MTYQKAKEEIIESSPQKTDAGKEELYLYSLRKMAEENVENNRTGLTNLHNINSFFYLCGEMIKQQPDKKYSVIIMDIVQFKAVNEFCGRDEGDRLLRFIASCFDWYENNRPDSYACHIRADIFCLCTSYEEVEELEIIVREIRKKITDFPFAYRVQPSFGIGISPERAPAISYLKDCATMAMNSIKGKVYRTYAVFDEKMRSQKMRERQVQMIGKYKKGDSTGKGLFNDVFDGKGHSLNNLRFEQTVNGSYYAGLFSGISTTGTIKNLILGQAVYNKENDTKNAAFLAGINRGEINNCILQNCTVEIIRDDSDFGNLTNWNEGIIINCHVDNVRLKNEIPQGNALTRYNQGGKIINCAVTNCNFSKAKNRSGLICSITKNGEILNCYLKGNTSKNHAICLQTENTNIRCCYYPYGDTREPVGNNYVSAPSDSIMQYGSQQSITEDNLYQILNQWVRDSGARLYPESSFLLWEKGETLPAILVSP
jgi:diguanylate cyclase (GGDEF)-like protein